VIAARQAHAETWARGRGVEDFAAFFSDLGVSHPDQLYSDAKWQKVLAEFDRREAEEPAVEGEVIDGQESLIPEPRQEDVS
jgi:hypothetical protein